MDSVYKSTVIKVNNNVSDYNNFANLYFAGLEIFNQTIAQKNNISLENVETYEMGHWIKFDGKTTDEENNSIEELFKDLIGMNNIKE